MQLSSQQVNIFRKLILSWYQKHKRDLPWRSTREPYNILLSEVMAQQTQLTRVIPKYLAWLEKFPTLVSLANAKTRDVLVMWSGLGYNRRALYLHKTAKEIIKKHQGIFPQDEKVLKTLPGIGEYTSCAIACFAFDRQIPVVDTNIRKVIAVHFFEGNLPDEKTIAIIAAQLLPEGQAYEWNQALMDYAASELKQEKIPVPKQSQFKTSDRYYRGQIIKLLITYHILERNELFELLQKENGFSHDRFEKIIAGLRKDKLIKTEDTSLTII